jgi:asparagine synthase (glutamine-hydrolysing)
MTFLVALGPPPKIEALHRRWEAGPGRAAGRTIASAGGMAMLIDPRLGIRWSADRSCLLLGDLFEAGSGAPAPPCLPLLARPADLGPFLSQYWGSYLLFCRFGPDRHAVLRDPSGALPLYRTIVEGAHCYFDDAAGAAGLDMGGDSIDADFLRHWLCFPFLRTARTGRASIEEILPGEIESVEAGRSARTALWTPRPFIDEARQVDDFDEAARLLRARLLDTIPAIAAARRPFALQLSGGLDSSIICAVLGTAGIPFDAINYFTPSPDGDERRFARAAAGAAGAPLAECPARPADHIEPALPRSFRPLPNLALRPLFRALDEISRERGASALVDGTGGDNLFSYLTTVAPALDAWRVKGPAAAIQTLDDLATLCGATFWSALAAALRRTIRVGLRPAWSQSRLFMRRDAVLDRPDPHPWLDLPANILPGKAEHVEALVSIQHFLDRGQPLMSVPMVHPLMAQPLIELCLSIPSWLWLRGGRDRAVARRAADGLLPPAIAARRAKGRLESLFLGAYMSRRRELADLLLSGHLQAMGILDRPKLERYLLNPSEPADADYVRILEISALEEWVSSWKR